jgi:hypothetical protein
MDIKQLLTKDNRTKAARFLFDLALLIELVLMVVEKSELSFSMESYVFRVTFVLTLVAVLIMDHSNMEWAIIMAVWVFTFICYRLTGRNELLRFSTFVMAARDIDLKKTMKFTFYLCVIGFGIIALLSLFGVLGSVSQVADYGREDGGELRYVLGFGHPNTLYGCAYALMLMWLWIYGKKAGIWAYLMLIIINAGLYLLTVSRTSLLIGLFTVFVAIIARVFGKLSEYKLPYILTGIVTPISVVAFTVWAAYISPLPRYFNKTPFEKFVTKMDATLNNRIHNLYREYENHAGSIWSWKLFSAHGCEEYFDMGWARLFYWYGIIPTAIICILVIVLLYICYKKKDIYAAILILSLSIYTVIEATFVSVYIGRNFILPIVGVYLGSLLAAKAVNEKQRN